MLNQIENILANYQPRPLEQKKTYAVLLPLVKVEHDWHILFEVRSETISQPGEVAFPGGRVEPDEALETAVIRETCEELNLTPTQIEVLGEIDYVVNSHSTIHCFVGHLMLADWQQIQPNQEVAQLFTLPLKMMLDQVPTYYTLTSSTNPHQDFPFERLRDGVNYKFTYNERKVPFYEIEGVNIWGMTALLVHRFTEILQERSKNTPLDLF